MGDVEIKKPAESTTEEDEEMQNVLASIPDEQVFEQDKVIQDDLIELHRFRLNKQFNNRMMSTCPILPKFHIAHGDPIDRQEVSSEAEH